MSMSGGDWCRVLVISGATGPDSEVKIRGHRRGMD
jgi:hypothetical protein